LRDRLGGPGDHGQGWPGLRPPGPRVTRRLGPHPARLAPLRPKQPIEEMASRRRHPVLRKQRTAPRLRIPQRRRPQLRRLLDRCACRRLTPQPRGARSSFRKVQP
jgi:hypothetical protein